jgi:hypothetical protein
VAPLVGDPVPVAELGAEGLAHAAEKEFLAIGVLHGFESSSGCWGELDIFS